MLLAEADVVFCTIPSTKPLLPTRYLKRQQAKTTGCFVTSIGSWQSNMIELDSQLLQDAAESSRGQSPLGSQDGVILIDDREECLRSSGEFVQSQFRAEQLVEVGEMLSSMVNPSSKHWLRKGALLYESIGVSSAVLVAGNAFCYWRENVESELRFRTFRACDAGMSHHTANRNSSYHVPNLP